MSNLIIQINVTVSFRPTAAEIEQIVTITINVTIDFWPTAEEIEQIVTLTANVKRNILILFVFAINVTICSISAAVGRKSIVTLICLVTICSISAAVRPKSVVTLICMVNICEICAALRQNSKARWRLELRPSILLQWYFLHAIYLFKFQ